MSRHKPHLTLEEVDDIARLARLRLDDGDRTRYQDQLSAILEYVDTLQALDTKGIDPSFRMLPMGLPLRADEVKPSLPAAATLSNAPSRHEDYFRIPRILEET